MGLNEKIETREQMDDVNIF